MVEIHSNSEKLIKQSLLGKISPPTMLVEGGEIGGYVTTWDGKPKIGIGIGGIKFNVKMGDPCFGWPETEYLEPGVSLHGVEAKTYIPRLGSQRPTGSALAFIKMSCVGNRVTLVSGEGKNISGVIVGKGGTVATANHVFAHFNDNDLEKLDIGDKARVEALGIGLEVNGFKGRVFNMSPSFLNSLNLEINNGILSIPVVKEIPAYAMGQGAGGPSAHMENWCIQTSPPHLVEELDLKSLKFGDLVTCRDVLMSYGKGYFRGAITVGIIMTGASEIAGNGLGVMAIASSKKGMIKSNIDPKANLSRFLQLED